MLVIEAWRDPALRESKLTFPRASNVELQVRYQLRGRQTSASSGAASTDFYNWATLAHFLFNWISLSTGTLANEKKRLFRNLSFLKLRCWHAANLQINLYAASLNSNSFRNKYAILHFDLQLYREYNEVLRLIALLKTWTVILRRKKACPERSRRAEESHFLIYNRDSSLRCEEPILERSEGFRMTVLWLFNRARLIRVPVCCRSTAGNRTNRRQTMRYCA